MAHGGRPARSRASRDQPSGPGSIHQRGQPPCLGSGRAPAGGREAVESSALVVAIRRAARLGWSNEIPLGQTLQRAIERAGLYEEGTLTAGLDVLNDRIAVA